GYLMGDREESGIVAPKGNDHGDLVCCVSIVAEEGQDLEKIFRETIGIKGNQTWGLVGLLEVVGRKGSLMLELVE
ncbi:hypothetical protein A2U01_0101522, partial [Trifolium medium]|nr:hypothetical protein [Trifolium medium]